MIEKKKKGMALIVVIVALVVLSVLGASILSVSLYQVKSSERENKKIQAYYLAKMGAQATLTKIMNGAVINDGTSNTICLQNNNTFNGTLAGSKGSFTVAVDNLGSGDYKITSNSIAGGVSNKVIVNLDTRDIGTSAEDAGWMNTGSGGQLLKKGIASDQTGKTIYFNHDGLKVENDVANPFRADNIIFNGSFDHVISADLYLYAKVVMFYHDMTAVDDKIVLNVLGAGITGPNTTFAKWGLVYVNNVWYYFGDGQRLNQINTSYKYTGDTTDLFKLNHYITWSNE